MGLTRSPNTQNYGSELSNLLRQLYESSGDRLAIQYGGSGLAHTLRTFNTKNVNDTLNSLKRYYKNVFEDKEKQNSLNLFLGVYKPFQHKVELHHLETDYFLHMKSFTTQKLWLIHFKNSQEAMKNGGKIQYLNLTSPNLIQIPIQKGLMNLVSINSMSWTNSQSSMRLQI